MAYRREQIILFIFFVIRISQLYDKIFTDFWLGKRRVITRGCDLRAQDKGQSESEMTKRKDLEMHLLVSWSAHDSYCSWPNTVFR